MSTNSPHSKVHLEIEFLISSSTSKNSWQFNRENCQKLSDIDRELEMLKGFPDVVGRPRRGENTDAALQSS